MDSIRPPDLGRLTSLDLLRARSGGSTYLTHNITGALPPSATGRGLSRAAIGRTEQAARIGADIAVPAPPSWQRLSVIVTCHWYSVQRALDSNIAVATEEHI